MRSVSEPGTSGAQLDIRLSSPASYLPFAPWAPALPLGAAPMRPRQVLELLLGEVFSLLPCF